MKTLRRITLHACLKIAVIPALILLMLLGAAPMSVQAQDAPGTVTLPVVAGTDTAPDLRFIHLTTDDGLSQNGITGILQDRRGFMWFATHDGLNRYDGNTFVVYKNIPNDSQSLSANFIHYLLEDGQGFLWIATNSGGVSKFDPITERFTSYRHNPDNPNSLSDDSVRCMVKDRRGYLWFGTADVGLDKFDPTTETFTHYRDDSDGQSVGEINGILEDSQGDIWFVSTNGLYHVNPQTGQIARPAATIAHNLAADYVTEDKDGNLWMLAWSPVVGLIKYDPRTELLTDYPVDPAAVGIDKANLLDDGQDGFWVPSSLGLYHFDRQTGRFTYRFQHDETNPASLNDSRVVSVFKDRSGVLWVGTESGGLNLLNFQQEQFGAHQHDPADPNSLSPGRVTGIYQDPSGIVWAGFTPRALDRLDPKTGEITHYAAGPDSETTLGQGTDVNCIFKDPQGYVWLSGWDGGLVRFDERSGQFKHYRHNPDDPNSLPSDDVLNIYQDRSGNLWIGQIYGLSRFDPATERFSNYQPDPSNPIGETNSVRIIFQDHSGTLWLGTWGGVLSRFDDQTKTFVSYTPDSRDPHKLNGGSIYAIHEDRAGTLWVGALDGLYRYSRENETFTRYTESQGLPSSVIQGVLEDNAGRLWLSTRNGLSRFDPQTETSRNYDVSDGLQGNDFSESSYAQGQNGELFFGGSNGFNAFFPESIRDNPYVPPVVVTDFKIFNKPVPIRADSVLKQAISSVNALTLSYSDNVFSFEFAALSYANSWKNRYRYQLEGLEPNWNEVGSNQRLAIYTNLDPGDYVFRVQASNSDGVWNEKGVSLPITITPPWWATWWFRTAAIAALLALAYGGYRWRVRSIQQRSQELERQVAARTRDLQIAADVSKQITTVLDIDRLLQQVVTLTIQGFDLYVAAIFLVDGDNLKLAHTAAAHLTSEALGERLVQIPIDAEPSIIALAARTREAVTVNDVRQSPLFLPLSLLPETRSELAIPMRLGNQLLGVFDLQAEQLNRFGDEDLRVLTTLADQIAIAVRNAALFTESQAAQQKAEAAQSAAETANQAKSVFLANMSHELRTPLNAILGYADILKRRMETTNPLADGLDIIRRSGEHLLTLINDVLDLAKIEAGKLELNPAPLQLPSFLRQIVGITHARAEAKDLALTYESLSPLPEVVLADETRLRQVLLNLLGNAVKFTEQGHVTLRVSANDEGGKENAEYGMQKDEGTSEIHHSSFITLHFEVEDTGVGIAPEQLERIFQPFEQAGEAGKRVEGTGLGLAISQQIVQLMGGRLQVKSPLSVPPALQLRSGQAGGEVKGGPGSAFWFDVTLPVIEAAAQEAATPIRAIVGYEGARRKVLVADDKDYNRQMLVDLLVPLGFEVSTAGDGQEAVDKALAWQPDAIVLDLVMPVKTGFEAAQEIRQRPGFEAQRVCIIAVSASVLAADQEKSRVAGCDAFLPKPIEAQRLLDLLAKPLGLAWIYAETQAEGEAPLVPPPAAELAALVQLADEGRVFDLQAQAVRLETLGEAYVPFARRLQKLARGFDIDQIRAFIKQFVR